MAYQDYTGLYDTYGTETEEERRRREAAQQPVTQKITYNPDGTQKMTITGTPESLSAANPYTPTVSGPVAPAETARPIMSDTGQTMGYETPQQMMTGAAMNAPVAPVPPQPPQQPPQMPSMTQTSTAQPAAMPSAASMPQQNIATMDIGFGPGRFQPEIVNEDEYARRIKLAQNDPKELMKIKDDPRAPQWAKIIAGETGYNNMANDVESRRARERFTSEVEKGNFSALAREMSKSSDEGSWFKYIAAGILGSERLARAEAVKLGIGAEWKSSMMGDNPSMIRLRADGLPMEGYNTKTGEKLNAEELAQAAAYYQSVKGAQAGSTVFRDPGTGKTLSKVDTPQGPIYYDKTGTRVIPKGEPFPLNTGSNLDLQNQLQIQNIRNRISGLKAEERIKTIESVNKTRMAEGLPLFSYAEIGIDSTGNLLGVGAPAAAPQSQQQQQQQQQTQPQQRPAAAPAAAPAPAMTTAAQPSAAPQPRPGESTAAFQRRMEAQGGAQKEIAGEAGKVVAASQETQNLINKIDNTIVPIIDSGKHNIGPAMSALQGRGPVAQAIGGQFETEDARNTRNVMETIDMLAIEGLKSLGANPSTRDLEFYTKNKPQANSDPEFVKSWIQSRSAALKRKLGYAGGQVEAGGAAGVAPPVQNKPSVSNW